MDYLAHSDELFYMVKMKLRPPPPQQLADSNLKFIYELLVKAGRSFALVIQELGDELRDAVCLFYLILRGLDTVEDDVRLALDERVRLLRNFHAVLYQPGWTWDKSGETENEELMKHFDKVITAFSKLDVRFQNVIAEITRRMGEGMAEFSEREVETKADYDLYCHYVAGLVGIGLSRLFAHSKLEDPSFAAMDALSNNMGLFLQKVNIIRDYLEDIDHKRIFWPRQIWSKYTDKLANFKSPQYIKPALFCLNDLITDAIGLIPDVLSYMSRLRNQQGFNFCAIPQVMAIATLALCYSNPDVFRGAVKIRRGLTAKMVDQSTSMAAIYYYFSTFLDVIESKLLSDDPNRPAMVKALKEARAVLPAGSGLVPFGVTDVVAIAAFALGSACIISRL